MTPEKERRKTVKRNYGLEWDEYIGMIEGQGNTCAICGTDLEKPFVDHDHDSGAVRGILCLQCNSMLGYARDNISTLASAIQYLHKRKV